MNPENTKNSINEKVNKLKKPQTKPNLQKETRKKKPHNPLSQAW